MTKRQTAIDRKREWNLAIAEGRVLRSQGGLSFQAFHTRTDALDAMQRCLAAGLEADIVDQTKADTLGRAWRK